ncbi:MAG: helix-turn-helix domain-containing protein [Ruminococcaceae bacterium]|nr:helix-turn-helix domain-containing protein [Oscillospiraceae bacterium]
MNELKSIITDFEIKGFHNIYYFEFGKDFTHAPEKHNFWEMVYVDSGKVLAITNETSSYLKQGQLIFHKPNETHAHVSDLHTPNNMLVVSFTCTSEKMKFFENKIFTTTDVTRKILSLFINEAKLALGSIPGDYNNKNNLDFSNSRFGSSQLMKCYLVELLVNIVRINFESRNNPPAHRQAWTISQNSMCELIENYMKKNLYSHLTLMDICSHFMYGKSQLSDIFKTYRNQSIMAYYNELKIAEAKKLLRTEKFSISQISDMLCFSCIHSFSRAFKKSVGVSPTDYKRRLL